jgi:hypothetical protein
MSITNVDNFRRREISDYYSFDFEKQILSCEVNSCIIGMDNVTQSCKCVTFFFKWFTVEEIRTTIENTGFKVINLFGEFDGSEFNNKSNNQIWVIEKI